MKQIKTSIAIIIPGGVGTGHNNIGVPVLGQIIRLLSRNFQVTVFQLFRTNAGYKAEGFDLVEVYSANPVWKYFQLLIKFRKAHRQQRFKIVHGFWALPNGFFAVLFGKMFGIKSVVSVLGGDAISLPQIKYGQLQKRSYRRLILWTLRNANEANALTNYLVGNLRKARFERADFKVIPWGIDTSLFTYRNEKLQTPVRFLHIGNLHPVKDQPTLLRAFAEIRKHIFCKLLIIGEGIAEPEVTNLISQLKLGDDVTVRGLVPYEQLHQFYGAADVLLHTSVSEGQSEVVTEAMCSGLLVCGTRVGLMHDLPKCCVSVETGDDAMLAKKTLMMIQNFESISQMRELAREWTNTHSILWTVQQYKSCYGLDK